MARGRDTGLSSGFDARRLVDGGAGGKYGMLYSTFKNIGESNIRKPSPINAMGMRIVISQERITVIFMALIVSEEKKVDKYNK